MSITYTVAIDWNQDGDFTAPGDALTPDVLALTWRLGLGRAHDSVAEPSLARILIRSPDGQYAPERMNPPLTPGLPIRIESHHSGETHIHFTGFVDAVEPDTGDQGGRRSIIHVRGPDRALTQYRVRLPLQVDATADAVIRAILDATPRRLPVLDRLFILDQPGHGELDDSTRLAAASGSDALEIGQSVFAYMGDTWANDITALEAIRAVAASERGRFFISRDGTLTFHNRHHMLKVTTSVAAFADSFTELAYSFGDEVVNQVEITLTPRAVGPANSILWQLQTAQEIPPGDAGQRQIIARFRDAEQQVMGALTVTAPARGVDYTANTRHDGLGEDRTAQVGLRLVAADAASATLDVRNNGSDNLFLLPGMQLRGTPLLRGSPLTLVQTDYASQTFYGAEVLALDLPALGSVEDASQLARYELARRATPRGRVRAVVLDARRHPTALALTLFDRVQISEAQTGHSGDYFIVAEEHEVDLGGARHRVRWLLEPADANAFWVVDSSALETSARLAY